MNEMKDGGRQKQRLVSSYDGFVLMLDVQTLLLELEFLDEIFCGCQGVFLVVSFVMIAWSVVCYICFESDDAFAMRRKL